MLGTVKCFAGSFSWKSTDTFQLECMKTQDVTGSHKILNAGETEGGWGKFRGREGTLRERKRKREVERRERGKGDGRDLDDMASGRKSLGVAAVEGQLLLLSPLLPCSIH